MPHPAGALATDIARVRAEQQRALAALGRGPTLEQQREMADLAEQHRELFADLELTVPQPRPDARPSDYKLELLSRLQRRISSTWRDTDLRRLSTPERRCIGGPE